MVTRLHLDEDVRQRIQEDDAPQHDREGWPSDLSVLSFFGPLVDRTEGLFRDAAEALVAAPGATTSKLVVVLETHGGYIEVVLRIAEILRYHFRRVEFIVPNYATPRA